MWTVIISMVAGNIIGGLITENTAVTLGIFIGQVSVFFMLKVLGYLKAKD
jgi:hypothetical protein